MWSQARPVPTPLRLPKLIFKLYQCQPPYLLVDRVQTKSLAAIAVGYFWASSRMFKNLVTTRLRATRFLIRKGIEAKICSPTLKGGVERQIGLLPLGI